VDYRQGQFTDARELENALSGVSTVIHMVSTTVPSTSNEDPTADIEGNLLPTMTLLESMQRQGVRKIVFLSSGGAVYGPTSKPFVPETAQLHPICSYAIVKLTIESYLHMYHKLHGLQYVILRVANPYGERQGHLGVQGVIGTFMNRLQQGQGLEIWGDGSIERDYVYVGDVARACSLAVDSDAQGVFNIGSGAGHSLNSLVKMLENVTGQDIAPEYMAGRDYDVPRIVLDCSKAREALGWSPEVGIDDGLQRTWRWLTAQ
jgi:UDP-glucose 4-epimerase